VPAQDPDTWGTEGVLDCGGRGFGIISLSRSDNRLGRVLLRCRRWGCASCGPLNAQEVVGRFEDLAPQIVYHLTAPLDHARRARLSTQARRLEAGVLRVVVDDAEEHILASLPIGGRTVAMTPIPRSDGIVKLDALLASAGSVRTRFSGAWSRHADNNSDSDWAAILPPLPAGQMFRLLALLPVLAKERFGPGAAVDVGTPVVGVSPADVISLVHEAAALVLANPRGGSAHG